MKKANLIKTILGSLLALSILNACGSGSSNPGAVGTAGEQTFKARYSFDDNGCIAKQEVTGKTQAEANQKICEAAANDALNNNCAGYFRDLYLIQNCSIRRPVKPAPLKPKPGREAWNAADVRDFDYAMKKVTLRAFVADNATEEAKFVTNRIAACGLTSRGSECLDAKQVFGEVDLFKDGDGYAMSFPSVASKNLYVLQMQNEQIKVILNGKLVGTIDDRKGTPEFPKYSTDYVEFYHLAKRVLDRATEEAKADNRLACEKCADLRDLQMLLKDVLNSRAKLIVGSRHVIYEDAILTLAFNNRLKVEDLGPLIENLSINGAASQFGKALVLNAHPDRTDLKYEVRKWVDQSLNPNRGIGMAAIGKTQLTRDEELFVISNLTGLESLRVEAEKIVRQMKLTDDHIPAIYRNSPYDLTAELMVKIGTVAAVDRLATMLNERIAKQYRIAVARALYQLRYMRGNSATYWAVKKVVDAQKEIETDKDVLKALDGDY